MAVSTLLFLFITLYCGIVYADPPAPVWPDQFQIDFDETLYYPIIGSHSTSGRYYYDYTNRRYRIDRKNGRFDRYCGLNGIKAFQNTPCTHLVVDGIRWIVYPEKKECCQCCSEANGCGILKPNWLEGAEFLGEANGLFKWNKPGLQPNYYFDRMADRIMLKIEQVPNDTQFFRPETFNKTISNPSKVFTLPSYCHIGKRCSIFSACHAVG